MSGLVKKETIEEIRARTDIVELIQSRLQLKRAGNSYVACCPFHDEKTPSFNVSPARQMFKCFGCGESGDVFSFVMKHDGMTFGDALRFLGERCGVQVTFRGENEGRRESRRRLYSINADLAAWFNHCLLNLDEARHARSYLAERGLSDQTVAQFQLGYAPRDPNSILLFLRSKRYLEEEIIEAGILTSIERQGRTILHNRFRGRLMFPVHDTQGRAIAFSARILESRARAAKYVNSPETMLFVKSRTLYALDKAQRHIVAAPNRMAIVCEGQIDTIRCHASGFANTVAPQGTAFTEDHVRILKRYADSILLAFDSDRAGQLAAVRTAGLCLSSGLPVKIVQFPPDEDPDSFLHKHGAGAFEELIRAAQETIPFQAQVLLAQEEDPRSANAAGRISDGLLTTIAMSGNAVHRARMLQQAAEILAIPPHALEEEYLRRANKSSPPQGRAAFPATTPDGIAPATPPFHAQQVGQVSPKPPPFHAQQVGQGSPSTPPPLSPPSPIELSLCELLIHNMESRNLVIFIAEHTPSLLFRHPFCRQLAECAFDTARTDSDALAELQENGPPDLIEFIADLIRSPDRSGYGDFTEEDAAKDLILGLWRRHLEDQRRAINCQTSDPEERISRERQRAHLAVQLRSLKDWKNGIATITRHLTDRD